DERFDYEFIRAVPLPEYRTILDAALIGLIEHYRPYAIDFKIGKVDSGEVRDIHSVAIFDQDARVVFGVIQDITERKRAEEQLQLAASVFTHTREGIVITSAQGDIVDVNDAFATITGYSRSEVLGRNPRLLKSGIHPPELYAAMWQTLVDTGYWQGEFWNRRKNGELYPEMLTISAVRDASGKTQSYVALFSDISAIKQHQQQLEYIAHYDALTRLPNRVLLAEQLQQAMAQSRRHERFIAVVYLDLDGFKPVNDRYGHTVGDNLLVALAQRMKATLREGDVLARLGGDEFVAVLVDLLAPEDYEPVLSRLLLAASDPVKVGDAMLQVSASIGVTFYPHDGVDADQLLRHADQAMYQAKQAGKNRYHLFDIAHDAAIKAHRETLERIRRALDLREFVLYYQPKVNMKTGAVFGVEALIRWLHPERGLLAPAAFLPLIENHAISVELGEWVIDAALQQMTAWRAMGLDIQVSVNIGARQLQQPDFVQRLSQLLANRPGADPARLELEILETSALEDVAKVSELMYACRALGVGFALDDFGTGYSSLTYLKHLPAEMLKIDQTFVRDMLDDANDLAIVEAVVGLARAFRRNAIAEGVETVAHGELLLWLGCDLAQGYGIARPMPASEFPHWAATWRPDAAWTAWRDRRATRDEMAPIFIEVELRHWFNAFEVFLADEHRPPPPLAAHESRFARWRLSVDGERSHLASAGVLHDRAYALGRQLVDLHRQGRRTEAQARLNELRELRDACIHALRESTHDIDVEQSA
ncbi:MAG TPA: EAL domain-containing protein, partial [Rhodocyclaceae bacterium]|nr:EAL domain-containing protein [Rhodocyclaceae bacterium]